MHEYFSTITKKSATIPGVEIVFRRPSATLRAEIDSRLSPLSQKIRSILERREELLNLVPDAGEQGASPEAVEIGKLDRLPGSKRMEAADLMNQIANLQATGTYFETLAPMVVEIRGILIDGTPPTVAMLRDMGPETLYFELYALAESILTVKKDDVPNSERLITLPAGEDGAKNSSTAGTAEAKESPATSEHAGSTTPTA